MMEGPASVRQPAPQPGTLPVVPLVLDDLEARRALGVLTYGGELHTFNGRDALIDAYQEALDLSVYLRQAIAERDAAPDELSRTAARERERAQAEIRWIWLALEPLATMAREGNPEGAARGIVALVSARKG